ncbi:MAG TPA: glycoside hydrolase family 5 protein [Armatimonadota bacterium]|nr:glycoside hydrolase family 5 protein [Armatimonadota bacterium]
MRTPRPMASHDHGNVIAPIQKRPFTKRYCLITASLCWTASLFALLLAGKAIAAPADLLSSQTRSFSPQTKQMRLHVSGNQLIDGNGKSVLLRGVNIASLEWCNGGEHLDECIAAAAAWKSNIIRLPMAQDRWFGKAKGQTDGGLAYRQVVDHMVDACAARGIYILLDLHWSDRGVWQVDGGKLGQQMMPDRNSISFWLDVATRYKNHPNVLFDLYNEPQFYTVAEKLTYDQEWNLWRNGGRLRENVELKEKKVDADGKMVEVKRTVIQEYEAVGMQTLYDTVRHTGAQNIILVGGNDWGYDLSGVLKGYAIKGNNLIYGSHAYPWKGGEPYKSGNDNYWDNTFGKVSENYPVLMGEIGGEEKYLQNGYGTRLMAYAQQHHLHWTAWCMHPTAGYIIKDWQFTPTALGQLLKDELAR